MRPTNLVQRLARPLVASALAAAPWIPTNAHAATVDIEIKALVTDILIYEVVPVRVTLTNRGTKILLIYDNAFEEGSIISLQDATHIRADRAVPALRITLPSGKAIETARTIHQLGSDDSTGPISLLATDEAKIWEFPLNIIWDSPERMPLFTDPGVYTIVAQAYTSEGIVESAPVTVTVRTPTDAAAQHAVELIRSLSQRDLQALYEPQLASRWTSSIDEPIPTAVSKLAVGDHPTPYRVYANLALAQVYESVAYRRAGKYRKPEDRDPAGAKAYTRFAEGAMLRAGPYGALKLAKRTLVFSVFGLTMEEAQDLRLVRAAKALRYLKDADVPGFPMRSEVLHQKMLAYRLVSSVISLDTSAPELRDRILTEFPDSAAAQKVRKERAKRQQAAAPPAPKK